MGLPLMPKATAIWLVENTSLTFEQIADFCGLHILEVQAIADDENAAGAHGLDPISNHQLSKEDIERCSLDPQARLKLIETPHDILRKKSKGARYTPLARRQEKPDAIAWLLKNYPELTTSQITSLVGTTKTTIEAVRDRSHWNAQNIKPKSPISLGLCTQEDLDTALSRHHKKSSTTGDIEQSIS